MNIVKIHEGIIDMTKIRILIPVLVDSMINPISLFIEYHQFPMFDRINKTLNRKYTDLRNSR